MANIKSKTEARKKVREAQARTHEARLERERQNVDDAASCPVELGRLAAVDQWEQGHVVEIHAEGERRRHEHRQAGGAAVTRTLDRSEMLTSIAELAGVKVSEVRGAEIGRRTAGRGSRHMRRARRRVGRGECRARTAVGVARSAMRTSCSEAGGGCFSAGYRRRCGCGWLWSPQDARGFRRRMTVSSPFPPPAAMNALSVNRWQHGFC